MNQARMLLSHNYNISPDIVPPLSREAFAHLFEAGLSHLPNCSVKLLSHPHWIVDICFASDELSPKEMGELCAQALVDKRLSQGCSEDKLPDILILGGLKTTPATSSSPEALQSGEWGVDVVETPSATSFLQMIGWENSVSQRPAENIFKVERVNHTSV